MKDRADPFPQPRLFSRPLEVINVGLDLFAQALREQKATVVQADWRPPAEQPDDIQQLLDQML